MSYPNAKKRKLEDLDVCEIAGPRDRVTVHGIVTELSPVKCSRNDVKYFTGKMTDGKKTVKMVSFDPQLRGPLADSLSCRSPVAVTDCKVEDAEGVGTNCAFKVIASRRGKILQSPKKFSLPLDLAELDPDTAKDVSVEEIDDIAVKQFVTVRVKVLSCSDPEEVNSKKTWRELKKQDCIVGDSTGVIRIVLWQDNIAKLEDDKCYKIKDAVVHLYDGKKYLSVSAKTTFEEIRRRGGSSRWWRGPSSAVCRSKSS